VVTPDSEPAAAKKSTHKKKGAHTHRLALLTVIDTAGWPSRLFRAGRAPTRLRNSLLLRLGRANAARV